MTIVFTDVYPNAEMGLNTRFVFLENISILTNKLP